MEAVEQKNAALAEALGMRYDKANRVMCGQRDGFGIIIFFPEKQFSTSLVNMAASSLQLHVHVAAVRPEARALTDSEKQELANKVKNMGFIRQDGHDITVPNLNSTTEFFMDPEACRKMLAGKLDSLCSFLRDKGFRPCCSRCGQETETLPFRWDTAYLQLCPACEADMRSRLASQEQKPRRKENVLLGVLGMLPGFLLGMAAVAWALWAELSLELVLIGAAIASCTLKGYELLGGRLTRKAAVIGSVIALPMLYVANRFYWAVFLCETRYGTWEDLYQYFEEVPMEVSSGRIGLQAYLESLVMLGFVLLLGAVLCAVCLFRWKKGRECREWFARLG